MKLKITRGIILLFLAWALTLTGVIVLAAGIIRSNDVTVNVVADTTPVYTLTVNAVPGNITVGNAFTVTGTLLATNGGAIDGKSIALYSNDVYSQNVTTVTGGTFSGNLPTSVVGTLTIHAEYEAN